MFAVQAGPVFVTWKKAEAYTADTKPTDYENPGGPPSFHTNGASIYLLYTARYVVSGSPVKTPRKMYWTERSFSSLGKVVAVPTARVGDIVIVYNEAFPRLVDEEYSEPSDSSPTEGSGSQGLQEKRTFWYEKQQHSLRAYNQEGRVFVEVLGDARSDNTRVHLGFEIVDVFKHPIPADVAVELGERITPPPPGDITVLFPEPIQQGTGSTFTYQHQVAGADRPEYYAVRETVNLNDYLVHWMEQGIEQIKWPLLLGRYKLIWPTDVARYSHYVRPLVDTENEAKETAITLSTANVPIIEYQDPLDFPRAKLTETFKFYTWLDLAHPAHRTLLRFAAGEGPVLTPALKDGPIPMALMPMETKAKKLAPIIETVRRVRVMATPLAYSSPSLRSSCPRYSSSALTPLISKTLRSSLSSATWKACSAPYPSPEPPTCPSLVRSRI